MATKKSKKPKHRRGKYLFEVEGALVFSGHATMYASKTKLGRFHIVVDTGALKEAESKESE